MATVPHHRWPGRTAWEPHYYREHKRVSGKCDGNWRHRSDGENRRGELEEGELEEGELEEEPKKEWRHGPPRRRDAPDHRGHDEQPRDTSRDHEGRDSNPDHRLLPPCVPPRAGGGQHLTGDTGAPWRAPSRESVTGQKRDRDWERRRECERDVWRGDLERLHGWAREHHGERRRPDILSAERADRGMQTFGAHAGRHKATATRLDPRRHEEHSMHGASGGDRGRSQANHRAPPLAPTGVVPPFASRALPYRAALGAARGHWPLELNKQLNQRLTRARSAHELLHLHAEQGGSFNDVNLATCWSKLGRVGCGEGFYGQLESLRDQTLDSLGGWDARSLANLAHALGKLEVRGDAWGVLWEAVARASLRRCQTFNPQDLANTAWGLAKAGHAAPTLLDAIAAETAPRVREFTPQALANTAWAYATAGHAATALLDAIAAEAAPRLREFKPQELANTTWAYATAGHVAPALLEAIAAEATPRVLEFNPQDLANTAWAFATAGQEATVLLDAIAAEAAPRVRSFTPQNLTNTAWAYATAGHAAPTLLDAIAAEAALRVREFNPQDLANTAWAFASAGHAATALLDAIAAEAAPRVREFNAQDLANTAWAYATAGHAATALLDAIASEAAPRVRELTPQNLANTVWAYATAGHAAPALLDAIETEAAPRVREFTPQGLANAAWAFAAADRPADALGLFGQQFARRCEELATELTIGALRQLHQWALWHAGERGRSEGLPCDHLLERCRAAFRSEVGNPSGLQRRVGEALTSLGLSPEEEVVLHVGYSLDFVVEWRGVLVGIEVDGPSHFVGREPNGATMLKRRQLRHLSWRLVSVPYWEWEELSRLDKVEERTRRAEYVRSLLDRAVPAN